MAILKEIGEYIGSNTQITPLYRDVIMSLVKQDLNELKRFKEALLKSYEARSEFIQGLYHSGYLDQVKDEIIKTGIVNEDEWIFILTDAE